MKILLIGSGGREHAISRCLAKSKNCSVVYVAPGNPLIEENSNNKIKCLDISTSNIDELLEFAKNENVDITIVGPEDPLAAGIVDIFEKNNLAIIGPNKYLAQLESSKSWAKKVMQDAGIPTAAYAVFNEFKLAMNYLAKKNSYPIVIKASGLAAGKGVCVAQNETEAKQALFDCFEANKFGSAGSEVVIEDFLEGEEASIFAFSDGKTILPMIAAQDHKALLEGDLGPNTGGMGAYAPAPLVSEDIFQKVNSLVFEPLQNYFNTHNLTYKGIIYAGLMIDKAGLPFVVEFNVRFGDPETQVVLPLLETDLVDIFDAILNQKLSEKRLSWSNKHAACVVMASKGYPSKYEKNMSIQGLDTPFKNSHIISAGIAKVNNNYVTNGGRVLAVVSCQDTLKLALNQIYKDINNISFSGAHFRKDIGFKAL